MEALSRRTDAVEHGADGGVGAGALPAGDGEAVSTARDFGRGLIVTPRDR